MCYYLILLLLCEINNVTFKRKMNCVKKVGDLKMNYHTQFSGFYEAFSSDYSLVGYYKVQGHKFVQILRSKKFNSFTSEDEGSNFLRNTG